MAETKTQLRWLQSVAMGQNVGREVRAGQTTMALFEAVDVEDAQFARWAERVAFWRCVQCNGPRLESEVFCSRRCEIAAFGEDEEA